MRVFLKGGYMKGFDWYIRRWFNYYILKPNYKVCYGSFRSYCAHRKSYEKHHGKKSENGNKVIKG